MEFGDIFKSGFLENINSVSIIDMIIAMVISFGIGMFIFFVYKKTYTGVMYAAGFGVTLVALTMITTVVILAVTSNVVLSLGMVGALSIVRFRAAIKDPLDITYLFWSIAAGIVIAAGMIPLAVIGSAFIGIVLLIFVNRKAHFNPYILIINCEGHDNELAVNEFVKKQVKKSVVKSKIVKMGSIELNMEVRLKDENVDFVNVLCEMNGVNSAALVSYNGDYTA